MAQSCAEWVALLVLLLSPPTANPKVNQQCSGKWDANVVSQKSRR